MQEELIAEKYIGIRPALGYPSSPVHAEKEIQGQRIGNPMALAGSSHLSGTTSNAGSGHEMLWIWRKGGIVTSFEETRRPYGA